MELTFCLLSRDESLAKMCREVLGEMFGTEWGLRVGVPGQITINGDVCLWDFDPAQTVIPPDLDPARRRRDLFLVRRKDLTALQAFTGTTDLQVLLKPVTRATLRVFLGGARQQREKEFDGSASLKAQRDEILQFLIQANLKLQEYDRERTNFLARAIHDFRAPLTALTGYCGLMLEEELGPLTAEQRDVLGRMHHSAKRLSHIANSMFQLTIAQNPDHQMKLEDADLRDCIEQALHEVAPYIESKRITVTTEIEPTPSELLFDVSQIERALINLLDNACKFTPPAGTIAINGYPFFWDRRTNRAAALDPALDRRVSQSSAPNSFRIAIRDSGPGIPAAHIEEIFEEYTSYAGGQDRSGGGLGLAICRMIVQQHQGRVWAESSPAGAVFSMVLPLQSGGARVPAGERAAGNAYSDRMGDI